MATGLLDSRVDALIDMVQPVNLLHPFAPIAWWMALPGTTGSSRLMDIMNPGPNGNHGTLTDMNPASDWVASNRLGGFGALDFDETNTNLVKKTGFTRLPDSSAFSLFATVIFRDAASPSDTDTIISIGTEDNTGENAWELNTRFSGGPAIRFFQRGGGTSLNGAIAISNGPIFHVGVTVKDGFIQLYVNGVPDTSTSGATVNTPAANVFLGSELQVFGSPGGFDGLIFEASIYNRALSSREAALLYRLGHKGYQGLLNRIDRRVLFAEAIGGSLPPISSRPKYHLIER